jgi:TatD DNase family protein
MSLIDTHCHLDFAAFDADRAEVAARARALGVVGIAIPGVLAAGWRGLLALCAEPAVKGQPRCYPALGLHPCFVDQHRPSEIDQLRRLLQHAPAVAIGEIGLDFAAAETDRAAQCWYFEQQLELARAFDLPVLLHVRKAHERVLQALRARALPAGGIVHAFSGSLEQARAYHALGFKLGIGGMLTYARSRKLRALVRELPLAALVLETDAPDMTVASHRYARNSPEYLPQVLAALAEVRGERPERIASATTATAAAVLRLDIERVTSSTAPAG